MSKRAWCAGALALGLAACTDASPKRARTGDAPPAPVADASGAMGAAGLTGGGAADPTPAPRDALDAGPEAGGRASGVDAGPAAHSTGPEAGPPPRRGDAAPFDAAEAADVARFDAPFILGADLSSVQELTATFQDTDGQTKSIFELLANHGFNYVRLKTFVDPAADYGYASSAHGCEGLREAYGDRDHVVEFGRRIKAAGMGWLLDFHYSDVWADPGNQIIPEAWREAASIDELAAMLKAYTVDVLEHAVSAGARPDMVQLGNEITPGLCIHVPGPSTDCWGNDPIAAPFGGSVESFANLGTLLRAGVEAVREVDPTIEVMLHVENTEYPDAVKWWVDGVQGAGVDFDVLGLSCYTAFQGAPEVWMQTFTTLARTYPDLDFAIAEYNPNRTEANRIMHALPEGRGRGTFLWEPTRSGEWGDSLFTLSGSTFIANENDFAEYDALLPELGL